MKLTTVYTFEPQHNRVVTGEEAVQHVVNKAMLHYDGREEREYARAEALQIMLGRVIEALIDNGKLRSDQIENIFSYDVVAEA